MAEQQAAPAPAEGGGEEQGGGIAEVLQKTDATLYKIASTAAQSQGMPEAAKAAFQQASQAFRQGLEALTGDGGQEQQTVTPEQGANPNAVPMSHGRPA